jgi:hypothetical protein
VIVESVINLGERRIEIVTGLGDRHKTRYMPSGTVGQKGALRSGFRVAASEKHEVLRRQRATRIEGCRKHALLSTEWKPPVAIDSDATA